MPSFQRSCRQPKRSKRACLSLEKLKALSLVHTMSLQVCPVPRDTDSPVYPIPSNKADNSRMRRRFFSDHARVNVDLHVYVLAKFIEHGHQTVNGETVKLHVRMRVKSAWLTLVRPSALRVESPSSSRMPMMRAPRSALVRWPRTPSAASRRWTVSYLGFKPRLETGTCSERGIGNAVDDGRP